MVRFNVEDMYINAWIGQPINIPIDPSKVVITKLKIDKDRNDLLARKERTLSLKTKGGKYTGKDVGMGVD
jgi:large subunit ribosomal protein L26e